MIQLVLICFSLSVSTVPDEDEPNKSDATEEEVEVTFIEGSDKGGEDKKNLEDDKTVHSEEGKGQLQGKESKGGGQLSLKAPTRLLQKLFG